MRKYKNRIPEYQQLFVFRLLFIISIVAYAQATIAQQSNNGKGGEGTYFEEIIHVAPTLDKKFIELTIKAFYKKKWAPIR